MEALGLGSRWARPLALLVWQDEENQASHLVNVEWTWNWTGTALVVGDESVYLFGRSFLYWKYQV